MNVEGENSSEKPPKSVQNFYKITDKAKCLLPDCHTELKSKAPSHLIRHIQLMHSSFLKEIETPSLSQMSPALIQEETLLLCVRHVTIHGRPFSSLFDESFKTLCKERLYYINRSRAHINRLTITMPHAIDKKKNS